MPYFATSRLSSAVSKDENSFLCRRCVPLPAFADILTVLLPILQTWEDHTWISKVDTVATTCRIQSLSKPCCVPSRSRAMVGVNDWNGADREEIGRVCTRAGLLDEDLALPLLLLARGAPRGTSV